MPRTRLQNNKLIEKPKRPLKPFVKHVKVVKKGLPRPHKRKGKE